MTSPGARHFAAARQIGSVFAFTLPDGRLCTVRIERELTTHRTRFDVESDAGDLFIVYGRIFDFSESAAARALEEALSYWKLCALEA